MVTRPDIIFAVSVVCFFSTADKSLECNIMNTQILKKSSGVRFWIQIVVILE